MKSPRLDRSSKLSESLLHQLNSYALSATAAGVGVLALASPAEAKIIYQPAHVKLGINQPVGYCLDFDYGVKPPKSSDCDFILSQNTSVGTSWWVSAAGIGGYGTGKTVVTTAGGSQALALRTGTKIGRRSRFGKDGAFIAFHGASGTNHTTIWKGQWANHGKGLKNRYLGLNFKINQAMHFGWARVSVSINESGQIETVLTGYAWETVPNKSIIAGKTKGPDVITMPPGSLGHLARGASKLRRRRDQFPSSGVQ